MRAAYGIFFADSPNQAAATVQNTGYRATTTYFGTLEWRHSYNYLSDPFPAVVFVHLLETLWSSHKYRKLNCRCKRHQPSPYSETIS